MKILHNNRSSGILLHPTSLAGPYGIGDLGPSAYQWIEVLARARQTYWQILPLGPTGYGDSPYQCFSAFAGNPYLISPDVLMRDGLLHPDELAGQHFPEGRTDYGRVIPFKIAVLRRAWDNFRAGKAKSLQEAFDIFCQEQRHWLDDYAFFMALKEARGGVSWATWPRELMRGSANKVLELARTEMAEEIGLHQFGQFLFFKQWKELRDFARNRGIRIIGDAPIFVASDSADVWANPKQFLLDGTLKPKKVAGVPPDYFSPTGQLWGNPLYDWEAMRETGYAWWKARLRATLELVDLVRLDHFRGFCAAWHVPPEDPTAEHGEWVPGPGDDLFKHLQKEFGTLPIIAEDLGEITPDVYELRDKYELPGMKVLQFAFDDPMNPFLPHHYTSNYVVYTGTHDNDTTRGWHSTLSGQERWVLGRYFGKDVTDVCWDLIRLAWGSVAEIAIAPLQDILDLGGEARMNLPGRPDHNWQWRMYPGQVNDHHIGRLSDLTEIYSRIPTPK